MFGISLPELCLIFLIVLLVFGPDKLPEFAKSFGKFMQSMKKNSDSIRKEFYNSVYPPESLQKEIHDFRRDLTVAPSLEHTCEACDSTKDQEETEEASGKEKSEENKNV